MHAILDVSGEPQITEMLGHAATLLDVGRAIDYYERFDHAATIATMADLAGFAHDDLGILAAILRQADEDARLGRFGQLIDDASKKSVLRASTILALAEELHRRIPPSAPSPLVNVRLEDVFEVAASVPQGWRPRRIADRFREVFGVPLVVRAMLPGWKVARIEAAPIPSP
jgi:exopolyphosphatase/pppGpp-phosphohydrolase